MAVTVKEINGSEIDQLTKEQKSLVIFYSATCGPCKMLRFVLKDIAKGIDDVVIAEIDFDKNREATARYGVESYPTLLLFQKGQETARLKGLQQKPVVLKLITG
jgi:thioredoxin 1